MNLPFQRALPRWLFIFLIVLQTRPTAAATGTNTETNYSSRTDPVEHKLRQFETAYRQNDFRPARVLAEAIRQTVQFEEQEKSPLGPVALPADHFMPVSQLPLSWAEWAKEMFLWNTASTPIPRGS